MLMERLELSERRACRAIGQSRTTQRRGSPVPPHEERVIRARLRELARSRPRYGYRRMTALLRTEGFSVNHKRIQRICRDEGLRVTRRGKKRARIGVSSVPADRLRATRPDHVWALDFCFDQTTDIRTLKVLSITDEFTREALAIRVERSITADDTVAVLEQIAANTRRSPAFIRMDNGPEMTAHALRDWCRFSRTDTTYIEPGHPWQNPYIESFTGKLRDELLNLEAFATLLEAKMLAEDYRIDYNTYRPHSSLGYRTPASFAAEWAHQPTGIT
jgi:putative transposase